MFGESQKPFFSVVNGYYQVRKTYTSKLQIYIRFTILYSISHFLLVVNSATNILVYCFLSSRFREECAKIINKSYNCFRRKRSEDLHLTTATTTFQDQNEDLHQPQV